MINFQGSKDQSFPLHFALDAMCEHVAGLKIFNPVIDMAV